MARETQSGGPGIESLSIKLLGSPEVSLEGRNLRFGRKKALALLCYLAAEGGKRHRRDLAELLWPTSEERRARTDLRSILTSLRRTLEEDGTSNRGRGEGIRFLALDGDLLGVEERGGPSSIYGRSTRPSRWLGAKPREPRREVDAPTTLWDAGI